VQSDETGGSWSLALIVDRKLVVDRAHGVPRIAARRTC
jgi:hypothetical protein